jgi:iron complex outermembrane receptor protein
MTPGDIVMMLNEMGGLRVQATSPSLGSASVRIQGLRGRYTRLLSDGLPLYGDSPGGLGLLQIPPMDLGQVEVIKGVASALHGAGAMGGVVNLISRRPGDELEREILVNQSTRGATDAIGWISAPLTDRWGLTFLGGAHRQSKADVDDDGWFDLAGYERGVARPRVFWNDGDGNSIFATTGVTWEQRRGGGQAGALAVTPDGLHIEALDTLRADAGFVGQFQLSPRSALLTRASFVRQRHTHRLGDVVERDRHRTVFGEAALRVVVARQAVVAGAAIERDVYDPDDVPRFGYRFTTAGAFVQDDVDVSRWLSLSLSARVDRHSQYGTFVSPRLSAWAHAGGWQARVSGGGGFVGSTALTEETEAAGLTTLQQPAPLRAERGRGVSIDVGRSHGDLDWTFTLFRSRVVDPVIVERENDYVIRNADGPTRTKGVELVATWRRAPFAATGTYTFVDAADRPDGAPRPVPLTPRHGAGFVAMIEDEARGRAGLEIYFTGRQPLESNPYRTTSERYVIVGLLVERRLGRLRLFVNGENLTGVRQGGFDPHLRPTGAAAGWVTVDGGRPLVGRVINGGVRVGF